MSFRTHRRKFVLDGNSDIEDLDPDVQDYSTDEDYNDVFDSTTNGYVT